MKSKFGFWLRLALIFMAVIVLAAIYVFMSVLSSSGAQRAVEETRQALRKQGFKTDLSDFNFSVPSSERGFELSLNGLTSRAGPMPLEPANLMTPAGSNSVMIIWEEDSVRSRSQETPWPDFAASVDAGPEFISTRSEVVSHPIRFNLEANRGAAMLLPQLSGMKRISFAFSSSMLVDLHEQNLDDAWTNLLATTRLVTAWEPESTEISHMVRFALASIAYETTWQALQTNGWSDAQLAGLQREWEAVHFFKNLPETTAFQRACAADVCQRERKEPFGGFSIGDFLKEAVRAPRYAPRMVSAYWSELSYRSGGTYEDEKALLLFYRDREMEMRQAVQAPTWAAMRLLPGVTNAPTFISKYRSRAQSLLNIRAIGTSITRMGSSFLGRAAEAETRRRLILAAIALERFRIRHGNYPAALQELTPDFLKETPVDFMDGQPLRYQVGDDGRFVLYSTGLDCVDNGGEIPQRGSPDLASREMAAVRGPRAPVDLVWPRAASSNEIAALREEELEERRDQLDQTAEVESVEYWGRTAQRQADVEKILASPPAPTADLNHKGHLLSEILRNQSVPGTNTLTLPEMLALHQVITGDEPEKVSFEVPISYDAVTKLGGLKLHIDPTKDGDFDEECVGQMECSRATNGNCLVTWNTIFEVPGKHALMLVVQLIDPSGGIEGVSGPVSVAVVSNLCQFSVSSATFDPATGANFRAHLPEMKADYTIDILSMKGERIKTINGSTSNGVINVSWDLIDDKGRRLSDESFNTVFHLTLRESGRSQTFKGP